MNVNEGQLRIAYFGTPDYSARFLEKLLDAHNIPAQIEFVVTQSDMPVGRKQIMIPSPVKLLAHEKGLPVFHNIEVKKLRELDLVILFAFGEILTAEQLSAPKYGFWNVHLSLLPAFRGATPTVFPLILGYEETGATLTHMDAELDHGPIIAQTRRVIGPETTNPELIDQLAHDMSGKLHEILSSQNVVQMDTPNEPQKKSDKNKAFVLLDLIPMHAQNHSTATYTRTLTRNDGFVTLELLQKALSEDKTLTDEDLPEIIQDFLKRNKRDISAVRQKTPAALLYNLWRGLAPWPGIWTKLILDDEEKRFKLLNMKMENDSLEITTAQLEGKNPAPFVQLRRLLSI